MITGKTSQPSLPELHTERRVALSQFSLHDVTAEVRKIVRQEMLAIKEQEVKESLLSPAETCKLFKPAISKVTLYNWTKEGRLQEHRIGGRVYYKYSEVLQSLQTLKKYKREVE